jgi:hypothetical protein
MEKRYVLIAVFMAAAMLAGFPDLGAQGDVNTTLEVIVPPVVFAQTIPDQVWPKNTDHVDAIRLSDHFFSSNLLTYSATPVEDITVEINQTSTLVSFYPDQGFEGVRNVTFIATDGVTNATSNVVLLHVINDTEPPQWFNPSRNRQQVFRTLNVTFSTEWQDNFALRGFVFSINEGSGWVDHPEVPFTGTQNISRKELQIMADQGSTVFWRFAAWDASGNFNTTDTQNFTVMAVNATGEDPQPEVVERPRITGLTAEPEIVRVNIKQGQSLIRPLRLNNIGNIPLNLTLEIIDLGDMVASSEARFDIREGTSKAISLEIRVPVVQRPDIYFGRIIVSGSGASLEIPVVIEVVSLESAFEIKTEVTNRNKLARIGDNVEAEITIRQTGDIAPMDIDMYYAILDLDGNVVESSSDQISLSDQSIILERSLFIPEHAVRGQYIFYARGVSENKLSSSSDLFEIGERFNLAAFIRINLLLIFLIIVLLLIAVFVINYNRNKRKLKLMNLYLTANELKELVKRKRYDDAVKVYMRLKAIYGEHISEEVLGNKEELKKEMEDLVSKIDSGGLEKPATEKDKSEGESEPGEKKKTEDKKEEKTEDVEGGKKDVKPGESLEESKEEKKEDKPVKAEEGKLEEKKPVEKKPLPSKKSSAGNKKMGALNKVDVKEAKSGGGKSGKG